MWVRRTLETRLRTLAEHHPVVALVGPRQSGKTSLLRHLFPKSIYFSLDDPGIAEVAREDPKSILAGRSPVILDEIQAAPELLPHIKAAVDQDRRPGRFLISGSQNLLVHSHLSEVLAGRAVYLTLLPFDFGELTGKRDGGSRKTWMEKCAYPEPFLHPKRRDSWLKGFIQTYLERDVRKVAGVADLRDFARFLRLLSHRNGQMLNMADLASDVGTAPNTVKRWISILEASYQVFLLEPYLSSPAKRAIKTPKVYFVEPHVAWQLADGPPSDPGKKLEAALVASAYRWAVHSDRWRAYFYRTKEGGEVDLVLESKTNRSPGLLAAEIKNTRTFSGSLIRGLRAFERQYPGRGVPFLVSHVSEPGHLGNIRIERPEEFLESLTRFL